MKLTRKFFYLPSIDINRKYLLNIRPEKFFLCFALLFGLIYLFVTPPLQVPDEPAHFLRSWQVSEGQFTAIQKDQRVGGEVPLSLEKFCHPFWLSIFPGKPLNADTMKHAAGIELQPEIKKFKDFNNTALYSPLCYAPQALGIFLLRIFEVNPFYIFYFARLATFFTWLLLVFYAIRNMPFHKWLMVLLALVPMSLYVNMSLSADVMTNAICFLFISVVLKYTFDSRVINNRRILTLLVLSLLVVSLKNIYMPLVLLLLIIPGWKYEGKKNYYLALLMVFICSGLTAVFWSRLLQSAYITYENYNPAVRDDLSLVPGADIAGQIRFILENGSYMAEVLLRSFGHAFQMYAPGFIGTFGWLSVKLPLPVVLVGYFLLVFTTLSGETASKALLPAQRVFFLGLFIILFILVFVSQHLLWDPVGGELISNIQGRYLIPLVPLLLLSFSAKFIPRQWLPFLIGAYVIWSTSVAIISIYSKFYF